MYKRIHSQHHEIGSAITALGTAFGDAADIGLCFVAFHLVLGIFLSYQERWNLAAVVLLVVFEVILTATQAFETCNGILCRLCPSACMSTSVVQVRHVVFRQQLTLSVESAGGDQHPWTHRL